MKPEIQEALDAWLGNIDKLLEAGHTKRFLFEQMLKANSDLADSRWLGVFSRMLELYEDEPYSQADIDNIGIIDRKLQEREAKRFIQEIEEVDAREVNRHPLRRYRMELESHE